MASASSVSKQPYPHPAAASFTPSASGSGSATSAAASVATKIIPKLVDTVVGTPDFPHFPQHVDTLKTLENCKAKKLWKKVKNTLTVTPETREDVTLIRAGKCEEDERGNIFVVKKQKRTGNPILRAYTLHSVSSASASGSGAASSNGSVATLSNGSVATSPKPNRLIPTCGDFVLPFTGAQEKVHAQAYKASHTTSFRQYLEAGMQTDPQLQQLHEESKARAKALYSAHKRKASALTVGATATATQPVLPPQSTVNAAATATSVVRALSPNGISPANAPLTPSPAPVVSRTTPEPLSLSSGAASQVTPEPPQLSARPPAILTLAPSAIKSPPLSGLAKRALVFSSPPAVHK